MTKQSTLPSYLHSQCSVYFRNYTSTSSPPFAVCNPRFTAEHMPAKRSCCRYTLVSTTGTALPAGAGTSIGRSFGQRNRQHLSETDK